MATKFVVIVRSGYSLTLWADRYEIDHDDKVVRFYEKDKVVGGLLIPLQALDFVVSLKSDSKKPQGDHDSRRFEVNLPPRRVHVEDLDQALRGAVDDLLAGLERRR